MSTKRQVDAPQASSSENPPIPREVRERLAAKDQPSGLTPPPPSKPATGGTPAPYEDQVPQNAEPVLRARPAEEEPPPVPVAELEGRPLVRGDLVTVKGDPPVDTVVFAVHGAEDIECRFVTRHGERMKIRCKPAELTRR